MSKSNKIRLSEFVPQKTDVVTFASSKEMFFYNCRNKFQLRNRIRCHRNFKWSANYQAKTHGSRFCLCHFITRQHQWRPNFCKEFHFKILGINRRTFYIFYFRGCKTWFFCEHELLFSKDFSAKILTLLAEIFP